MKLFITLLTVFLSFNNYSQLVVSNAYTPQQLVVNKLIGSGITVSNILYRGDSTQRGFFDGSNSNIGIDSGIILCSGNINDAIGPNNSSGFGGSIGSGIKDPDIERIANLNSTPGMYDSSYDVSSLEFDFVTTSDSLVFSFVFASEEYLEFINTGVNDAFGFFISGPGITGPFARNAINLAKVPGTSTFISIDSVNNIVNNTFYIDNGDGTSGPQLTNPSVVQFDGFTTKINIATKIQCNQTYHIKLAIGDIGDGLYNSAVFIEGNTFKGFTTTPKLTIVDDKDTICLGDSIILNVSTNSARIVSLTPSTVPPVAGVYTLTPTTNTTYQLIVEDTTACGLFFTDTSTLDVVVRPSLSVDFTTDSICLGDSTSFTNLTSGFLRTILWEFGDGDSLYTLQPNFKHLYNNPGSYQTKLKVVTSFFCSDSITKTVTVFNRPTLDYTPINTCQFDGLTIPNNSTMPGGNLSTVSWLWNYDDGNTSSLFNGGHTYLLPGSYDIQLTSLTPDGCQDSLTKKIIIHPKPTAFFSADTMCLNHITNFTDLSTGNITDWNWNPTAIPQIQNPSYLFSSDGSFPVTLTVKTDSGCIDDTTINVIVNPNPVADFTFSPFQIYIFDTDVCFQNNSSGASSYVWNFDFSGTTGTSTLSDPCEVTFPNNKPNVYSVKLYAINSFGCIDSISKNVEVLGGFILYVPNSFSPNDDGINDEFLAVTEGIQTFQMQIFNRWGEKIFETNKQNEAWDGTFKGQVVQNGTYVYRILLKDIEGISKTFEGHINVIR